MLIACLLGNSLRSSCHYCSVSPSDDKLIFKHLPTSSLSNLNTLSSNDNDRIGYIHLLNHTYEEIDNELGHLLMNNTPNETYRLFETKSIIHAILLNLIDILFTNLIHSDTYLSELIEQYTQLFHIFYAHFIPFVFRNINCIFDLSIDQCLNSSLDILALIFQRACCQQNEQQCSFCMEFFTNKISNERNLMNKNLSSEYSTTNIGIEKKFELDDSIFHHLIDFSYSHTDEIIKHLKNQTTDNDILPLFRHFIQMYRMNERT